METNKPIIIHDAQNNEITKELVKDYLIPFDVTSLLIVFNSQACLGEEGNQLYVEGMNAYQQEDYVSAVKFLFAYQQMNKGKLDLKFDKDLTHALDYSELKLRSLIETDRLIKQKSTQRSIHSGAVMAPSPSPRGQID